MSSESNPNYYKEHPRRCAADDYWGQVRRTVNGRPVSQEQIGMIVAAIRAGLKLRENDVLLDLCCGNGALSVQIFEHCQGGVGVDFSEALIQVANDNFKRPDDDYLLVDDVVDFVTEEPEPNRFTKAMCYGSLQYLSAESTRVLLSRLRERFDNVTRVFIGNMPDRTKLDDFFYDHAYQPGVEDDNTSAIGLWWSPEDFADMARKVGWGASFSRMPEAYYAAAYRFDITLTPKEM